MHVAKDAGWIGYRSRRTLGNAEFVAQYRATGPGFHPRPGTLEYFLTERYALYSVLPGEDYFRVTSTTRRGPCSQRRHRSNGTRFSKLMRSRSPKPRRYCTWLRAKTHLCGRRCSRGTNVQSLAHPRGRKREPRGWSAPRAALITRVEAVVAVRRVLGVGVPRARRPTTVLHGRRVIQRVLPISRVR